MGCGNVWPFSQMSSSFLIFSYFHERSGKLLIVCVVWQASVREGEGDSWGGLDGMSARPCA